MLLLKIPAKQGIIAESEAKARRLYNEHKARQESKMKDTLNLSTSRRGRKGVK